jgi:hypothetical protein
VLLSQLQADFLTEWRSPDEGEYLRYVLKLSPDGPPLDATLSLVEAGVADGAVLHLVREKVLPTSPVGLIVEDQDGHRFVTNVQLNTPIKKLAGAFMNWMGGSGEPCVELLVEPTGTRQYRKLRSEATLYDERIWHGAQLRIKPSAPKALGTRIG